MEELGSIRYLSHMDFSIFCSTRNSRKLLLGLRNAIAGHYQGEMPVECGYHLSIVLLIL